MKQEDRARVWMSENLVKESGQRRATLAHEFATVRAAAIEDVIEWMRVHLSGLSAPNEDDFKDMKVWLEDNLPAHRARQAAERRKP